MQKRKVVLGLGNLLYGDEGFGIHAVQALQAELGELGWVELVDGGVLGLNLLPLVESCSHLLVLDVVDGGQPAGSLIELSKDQIPLIAGMKMSEHQVGFQEVLGVASFRGRLPDHLHLIGAQPGEFVAGVQLSPPLQAALPDVLTRARRVLTEWDLLHSEMLDPQGL